MLPIAILQNDESVRSRLLGDSLAARRTPVELVEVFRGDSVPDLDEVSGVVILGGHMGAYEDWIRRDGVSLHEIGVDPIRFLGAVRAAEDALRDRADRKFGAWIAEVQSASSDQ